MLENFISKTTKQIISRLNQLNGYPPDLEFRIKNRLPLSVFVVSLTTRCNFNCPHCLRTVVDDKKALIKDLPISIFETILKEGKKLNFELISFTGGEPILHPQFSELVSLATKYGYKYNFASNGWLYQEYWKIIKQNRENLEMVIFSLDGATAEVHDAVRNKPGSFEKLIEAIKFYRKQRVPVKIAFCLTNKNFHQIEKIPDFCLRLGVKILKWAAAIPLRAESNNVASDYALADNQRDEALQKILSLQEKFNNQCYFSITSGLFPVSKFVNLKKRAGPTRIIDFCSMLNGHSFYIDHDGGMLFCCDINRQCKNKPLVHELGFEKSLEITLDVISELKKRRLYQALRDEAEEGSICDFCNQNIESCLSRVNR